MGFIDDKGAYFQSGPIKREINFYTTTRILNATGENMEAFQDAVRNYGDRVSIDKGILRMAGT